MTGWHYQLNGHEFEQTPGDGEGQGSLAAVHGLSKSQTGLNNQTTMAFPVVMYRSESWIIKKAECQRTDAFELWCWRRLLRVPWIARRSNQSFLKEVSPEYSLKGLMLKLKLQFFGHLMQRANSLEKTLMLGKIEGGRRRGQQRMRRLYGVTNWMDIDQALGVGDGQGSLACCSPWSHRESDTTVTELK